MKRASLSGLLLPAFLLFSSVASAAEIAALSELASKNDREVELLPFHSPGTTAGEGFPGLSEGISGDDGDSALTPEPGSIVILAASSIPETSLRAIARDAARLGIPLALSGRGSARRLACREGPP